MQVTDSAPDDPSGSMVQVDPIALQASLQLSPRADIAQSSPVAPQLASGAGMADALSQGSAQTHS